MASVGPGRGFSTERVRLVADRLPADASALRFVHLSDLHLRALRPEHDRLVELIDTWAPDFIFLTGDLICGDPPRWPLVGELVGRMHATHGTFACRGNWEVESGPPVRELRRMMAGWGATLLVNESRRVRAGGGTVCVCGVDDLPTGWPDFEAALSGSAGADYVVLLSHAPLAARLAGRHGRVDLILSGHTHGGQIRVPLLWRMALPPCTGGFTAGLYRVGQTHLYVSRGFGANGPLPVRFRCPAEVTLFELDGATAA